MTPNQTVHCGVLPATTVKDSNGTSHRYYIFGVHRESGDLCVFGGKPYINEGFQEAAIREFIEESENFFTEYTVSEEILDERVFLMIVEVPPIVPKIDNVEIKEVIAIEENDLRNIVTGKGNRTVFSILLPALQQILS